MKQVYVYDFGGELIEILSTKECLAKYQMSYTSLETCLSRGSLYNGKYYFSRESNFKPSFNKYSQNGLNPNKYKTMRSVYKITGEPDLSDYQDYILNQ